MDLFPEAFQSPGSCPTCKGNLTDKLACWRCCDRLCRICGELTGSAFLETCWSCWFLSGTPEEEREDMCKIGG